MMTVMRSQFVLLQSQQDELRHGNAPTPQRTPGEPRNRPEHRSGGGRLKRKILVPVDQVDRKPREAQTSNPTTSNPNPVSKDLNQKNAFIPTPEEKETITMTDETYPTFDPPSSQGKKNEEWKPGRSSVLNPPHRRPPPFGERTNDGLAIKKWFQHVTEKFRFKWIPRPLQRRLRTFCKVRAIRGKPSMTFQLGQTNRRRLSTTCSSSTTNGD